MRWIDRVPYGSPDYDVEQDIDYQEMEDAYWLHLDDVRKEEMTDEARND